MSEKEKDLREARHCLARSSKAEVGPSNVSEAGVGWKGTWEDQHLWYSVAQTSLSKQKFRRTSVVRKESVETQDFVSCQDVELGVCKSLEELFLIPSAVGEPLGVKHLCDGKCDGIGFKFHDLAAIVTEEGGTPHTINLCRKCCACSRERNKARERPTLLQKSNSRQVVGRFGERSLLALNVGTSHGKGNMEQLLEAAAKQERPEKRMAVGRLHRHTRRSASTCEKSGT